jgi:hypothetical protein
MDEIRGNMLMELRGGYLKAVSDGDDSKIALLGHALEHFREDKEEREMVKAILIEAGYYRFFGAIREMKSLGWFEPRAQAKEGE